MLWHIILILLPPPPPPVVNDTIPTDLHYPPASFPAEFVPVTIIPFSNSEVSGIYFLLVATDETYNYENNFSDDKEDRGGDCLRIP